MSVIPMRQFVDISFDCLPLRSVGRLDVPIDASPKFRALCERIKDALTEHGQHNSYYLHNAHCDFHLTNDETVGALHFSFEGTLLTDSEDQQSASGDLKVVLEKETCSWISEPIVQWFSQTVTEAVLVEFNRYIASGDLEKTKQRADKLQAASDEADGYLGMYL